MRYAVGVEALADGPALAHVLDLPGCMGRGATPQAALERLFVAIPAYWTWLGDHGVAVPPVEALGPVTLAVVDLVWGSAPQGPRERSALFAPETEPCTAAQIALGLTRLAYSRADLLALLEPLSAAEWVAPRPDSSPFAARVQEIAAADHWLVSRLGLPPPVSADPDPLLTLHATRAVTAARLAALSPDECATIYVLDGERWTVRKVLRRMLEHECEQVAQLGTLLAAQEPVDNS